jgi:hypothetical protein
MKWPKTKRTEYHGLLYIEQLVNETGNIFRKIHLEEDVGLDGVIEFVKDGEATGRLLAIQVKSGDSYVVAGKDRFIVPVDEAHLNYWQSYDLPVVIVCYSPSQKLAAWEDIKQYIQYQRQREKVFPQEKVTIKSIEVPFSNELNAQVLSEKLYLLTSEYTEERFLFDKANMTLSSKADERRKGMLYISLRREKLATRLTAFLARQLILDENIDVVRLAASTLGYCIAHRKWSFYPDEDLMNYTRRLCRDFDKEHFCRLMEAVDDGDFGPKSLGEAYLDCMGAIWAPEGKNARRQIVVDKQIAMHARANALVTFYGCDWDALIADSKALQEDGLGDIVTWIMAD